MKKCLIGCSVIVSLFFAGCSKEKVDDLPSRGPLSDGARDVYQSASAGERIEIYSNFEAAEKLQVWQQHFQNWLDRDDIRADEQKTGLIGQLSDMLNVRLFEDDSEEWVTFIQYQFPVWVQAAESVFKPEEIYLLTMENSVLGRALPIEEGGGDGKVPDCWCHIGRAGYSCASSVLTLGTNPSLTMYYGVCKKNNTDCRKSARGCGIFWRESCDGNDCTTL